MKRYRGMTFIEILIAIVITSIVLSSMYTGLNFASKYARHNANKTMALNFAQAKMEELRNLTYGDLAIGETTGAVDLYQNENVDIHADWDVVIGEVTIDEVIHKTVEVTISWDWLGKSYTEEINTLRSNY